jgi:glycosyltransferase 2 family protein
LRADRRKALLLVAQLLAAALLVYYVGRTIAEQWVALRTQPLHTDVEAGSLLLAVATVLATYAMLIHVWRILMPDARMPFWRAARVWSVAGLWRYVPGKVWSIGALSVLAQRENVPAASAASASVLNTLLNIATGVAVALVLAWRWLGERGSGAQAVAVAVVVLAVAGLVALPYVLPRLGAMAARLSGRDIQLRAPSRKAIAIATAANLLSWISYGLAFMWLVRGMLGQATGAPWQYIAVFATSYVIGYLFLIAPGGIGPREGVMFSLMTSLGLATAKDAALVTVASRVWLTLLEMVPGLLFLAHDGVRRRPSTQLPTDAPRE